jgi:hypothetical protein
MKDFQTQLEEATNTCCLCDDEFSEDNPCCCDDGIFETPEGILHTDGTCYVCCRESHPNQLTPSLRQERCE